MHVHANAKLGPAGRLALTEAITQGMSQRAAAAAFCVSPATAHRWWHRRRDASAEELCSGAWLLDRSCRPRALPAAARRARPGADLRVPAPNGLGAAARRRRRGPSALNGLEGAPPPWPLAATTSSAGGRQSLRVALSRRFAAHGHGALRPLQAPGARRHWRSLAAQPQLDVARDPSRLRLRARDRRRPLAARLRRAAGRREGRHGHRLRRARARLVRGPLHLSPAADDRQRLQLRPQPLAARAAPGPRHQAPNHPGLPTPYQREGGALPPNDGPRVGLRDGLPLTPPPQPRAATLARPLQPAQAPQLNRGPAPISRVHNLRGQDS